MVCKPIREGLATHVISDTKLLHSYLTVTLLGLIFTETFYFTNAVVHLLLDQCDEGSLAVLLANLFSVKTHEFTVYL